MCSEELTYDKKKKHAQKSRKLHAIHTIDDLTGIKKGSYKSITPTTQEKNGHVIWLNSS